MSLINEALKKAQGDRPVQGPPPEKGHFTPPPKKKRKSFLWGFLLSVLVVGTFSILLSTYFVMQILGPEESKNEPGPEAAERIAKPKPEPEPKPVVAAPEEPSSEQADAALATEAAEEPEVNLPPEPEVQAMPPDPAVIARLMELEIRGIMSQGTRVLIFDQASGRNKAYREGDSLEGAMGLVVDSISNSSIKFKDYAGQLHTKSF